jgi:aminoglycoside/choline kinase family phosphotransferase
MSARPATRQERALAMDAFLARSGWAGATRSLLAGDASFRRYERVQDKSRVAVLMDAPPPWEDVRPFMHVTHLLESCDVTVPRILATAPEEGFLLLEDLGDDSYTRCLKTDQSHERALYLAAIDALIAIHRASAAVSDSLRQALPPYDDAVYLREAGLLAEWLLPQVHGIAKARALREEYLTIWQSLLKQCVPRQHVLVHRDYHADNLLWLPDRAGHRRVGMLDYQDALWGDVAYDLASLLEDARRDVGTDTATECMRRYRQAIGEETEDFATRYAVIAAQRNAKIIGIFVRLCVRDAKPHYLDYLPRVWRHFMADMQHPTLAPLQAFIETHVPPSWRGSFTADTALGGIVP